MTDFLKIFKIGMKRDKILFVFTSILGIIISAVSTAIFGFFSKQNLEKIIINKNAEDGISYIGHDILPDFLMSIIPIVIVFISIVFIIIGIYKRLYNDDGSSYVLIQLPVRKEFHILAFILEASIFVVIQYISAYICIFVLNKYLINITNNYSYLTPISLFAGGNSLKNLLYNLGLLNPLYRILDNLAYRIFVTIPASVSMCMFFMVNVYKYGKKFIFIMLVSIVLIILASISIIDLSEIVYRAFFVIFETFTIEHLINSFIVMLISIIYSIYYFNNKLDF